MKILFPIGVAALVAAGCQSLPEADDFQAAEQVTLNASIADIATKTHLGELQAGNVIPVYWSDGDRINVNGSVSNPLTVEDKCTSADFVVRNVSAPYYAVYPASVYLSSDESGRRASILLPDTQAYSPDSFGEGAAVLYGAGGEDGKLSLQNLCGAIRVSVIDSEAGILKKFVLTTNSEEEHLAGYYSLDLQTGALEAEEVTNSVELVLPEEGVALSKTEARSFYLTIPAGVYAEGFTITMVVGNGRTMKCQWVRESAGAQPGVTVRPGRLVNFGPFPFEGSRQIVNADDWNEFATAVNSGDSAWKKWADEEGMVCLADDFEVEGDLVAVEEWAGAFDGQEHTITRSGATQPLFKSVSGLVQGLNLAGSFAPENPYKTAPLAGELVDEGILLQCSSSMDISYNGDEDVAIAAMAGSIGDFCLVIDCHNSGKINVTTDCTTGAKELYVGGIVALIDELFDTAYVDDCSNSGAIMASTKDVNSGLSGSGIGGIVGAVTTGDDMLCAFIRDCDNSGDVTFISGSGATAAYKGVYVGGIVGLCGHVTAGVIDDATRGHIHVEIEGCSNSGNIRNEGVSAASSEKLYQKVYAGGIAGVAIGLPDAHIQMSGCSNTGNVRGYESTLYSRASICSNVGGLVGLGGYIDIEECSVNATVGTTKRQAYCVGGAAAMMVTSFKMRNCSIMADLEMIQVNQGSTLNSVDQYALGVAVSSTKYASSLHLSGSEVSGCGFGGSITSGIVTVYTTATMPAVSRAQFTPDNYSSYIVSPKYSGSDIRVSGNYFLN